MICRTKVELREKDGCPGRNGYCTKRSIKLFLFLIFFALDMEAMVSVSTVSSGQGGSSSVGSRSFAPRGTNFWTGYLVGCDGTFLVGSAGILSGEGPRTELGRENRELRRRRLGGADPVGGAVWGVIGVRGVNGVAGVRGVLFGRPLTRESHFLVEGVIAIFARASFWDIERRRL
jgi:hypothetical protein